MRSKEKYTEITVIDLRSVKAFLIRGEENILVDTGNPGYSEEVLDRVEREGLESDQISSIIITMPIPITPARSEI